MHRKRWLFLGGTFGAGIASVVVAALGVFAGTGMAAAAAAPTNVDPPQISGTPQQDKTLHGDRGSWAGGVGDYNYFWVRCDNTGASCSNIAGAHASNYKLTSADVGNTIRFKVQASNKDGSTFAASVPTAVIQSSTPKPPPAPATGCPAGSGPAQVTAITSPARLVLDQMVPSPGVINRSFQNLTLRIHVSDTCGQSVQGALVYAAAIPFNQISNAPEQPTGGDGWATITFARLPGFPANPRQSLMAIYLRVRKPGENPAGAGISNSSLNSIPVRLNG